MRNLLVSCKDNNKRAPSMAFNGCPFIDYKDFRNSTQKLAVKDRAVNRIISNGKFFPAFL